MMSATPAAPSSRTPYATASDASWLPISRATHLHRLQDEEPGRKDRLRFSRGDVRARLHDRSSNNQRVVLAHLLTELGGDEPSLQLVGELLAASQIHDCRGE